MTEKLHPGLGSGALREARRLILAIAKESVELAIVRSELTWDEAADITEEQIAKDAALAIFGAGTCDDQPTESVQKLLALLSLSSPIERIDKSELTALNRQVERYRMTGENKQLAVPAVILSDMLKEIEQSRAQASSEIREAILDRLLECVAPCLSAPNSGFNEVKLRQMFGKALTPSRQGAATRVEG